MNEDFSAICDPENKSQSDHLKSIKNLENLGH